MGLFGFMHNYAMYSSGVYPLKTKKQKRMDKQEKLAKVMYDAYCYAVGGKAFNGDDLPKSEEFFADSTKQKQVNAWREAARTAINFLDE